MTTNQKISHCKLIRGRDVQRGMKISVVPAERGMNARRMFNTVADVDKIRLGRLVQLTFYRFGGSPFTKNIRPDGLYLQQLRTRRPKAGKNG